MSPAAGAAGQTTDFREYQWSYSVMDSSRVSTCLISMLLIVYGSFRSLNMEQEQREREKKRQNDSMNNLLTGEPVGPEPSKFDALNNFFFLPSICCLLHCIDIDNHYRYIDDVFVVAWWVVL